MKTFGILGRKLGHSFSKPFFEKKFAAAGLTDHEYKVFTLNAIEEFPALRTAEPNLAGFNVTIPYKQEIMAYLDRLDPQAEEIGAVNCVKVAGDGALVGYNTDYYGFKESLDKFLPAEREGMEALVLGTGGASKAVWLALRDLGIPFQKVSRSASADTITYKDIDPQAARRYDIWINCTPLGMYPEVKTHPQIPYVLLGDSDYLFDLVYNPEETEFLRLGKENKAQTKNGLEMLYLQAEKGWEIWTGA